MVACWGNGNIDHAALHEIDIGAALDQYHYLLGAHAFGQHGGHDVGLIVVGDSDEDIHLLDVLFRPAAPRSEASP